ncbi:MAG TPA: hypothetical protein VGB38_02405, partial [bacterium]
PWDRPEPPPVESSVQLSFDNSHWTRHAGTYAADIRPVGKEGYAWSFFVETQQAEETVLITWKLESSLPEGWKAYLFDLEEGNSVDVLQQSSKSYKTTGSAPSVRRFKWAVGTKAFIQNVNEGISLEPAEFHLFQNYPNPFNPQTTITYSLSKNGRAEIVIINALGQTVRKFV